MVKLFGAMVVGVFLLTSATARAAVVYDWTVQGDDRGRPFSGAGTMTVDGTGMVIDWSGFWDSIAITALLPVNDLTYNNDNTTNATGRLLTNHKVALSLASPEEYGATTIALGENVTRGHFNDYFYSFEGTDTNTTGPMTLTFTAEAIDVPEPISALVLLTGAAVVIGLRTRRGV